MSHYEIAPAAVAHHTAQNAGAEYRYTSIVEEVPLADDSGAQYATVSSFSYLRDDQDAATRPVLFLFNGGPGASSLYTHLGGLGPLRAELPAGPYAVMRASAAVPNEESLLPVADLVFVDPPDTGFARVTCGREAETLGTVADAKACARFIRGWLARHRRGTSPKFVLGESYGTIRAAMLAQELAGSLADGMLNGIALDGVILLGQALAMGPASSPNTELPFAFALPTQAAIAWHHGRSQLQGESVGDIVAQVQKFVYAEFMPALFRGADLAQEEAAALSVKLEQMTGLAALVWQGANLRIDTMTFIAALLGDKKQWVSMYDGRYVYGAPRHAFDPIADDPPLSSMAVACLSALQTMLPEKFNFTPQREYKIINFRVNNAWDWRVPKLGPPLSMDVSSIMAACMHRNPQMRLFVGSGAYDLVTTYGAAEYMLSRGQFPRERVTHALYDSGHSPYLGDASRARLSSDLRRFIRRACTDSPPAGR